MRVVIGYESNYGNTHRIADAIATGFQADDDVSVVPISRVDLSTRPPDLLIIGTPTHAHGLPRPSTRRAAQDSADTPYDHHDLDPDAAIDTGVREWLAGLPARLGGSVATFDTRFRPPAWLVGHPARRVRRVLARRGARVLDVPTSFFVDKHEKLRDGEIDRARDWGTRLRSQAAAPSASPAAS